jgi:ferrous iron transport protein A
MKASEIPVLQTFKVKAVADSPLQMPLMELGIRPGKSIRLLHKAPFSGPLAFDIGSSQVCIRIEEAHLIEVDVEDVLEPLHPASA